MNIVLGLVFRAPTSGCRPASCLIVSHGTPMACRLSAVCHLSDPELCCVPAWAQIGLRLHYGSKEDFVLSTTTEPASVSLSERSPARPVAPAASDQVPSIALWSPPGPLREGAVGQRMPSESGAALLGAAPEPSAPQGGVSLGFGIGVDINAGRNMGSNV